MSKPNTIGRTLCLAALLAVGFGLAWGFPVGWCLSVVQSAMRASAPYYEQLEIREDGTPLIGSHSVLNYDDVTYRTLSGEAVSFEEDRLETLHAVRFGGLPKRKPNYRRRWRSRIAGISDGRRPATYWYFLHDGRPEGAGYFVGYDSKSRQRVGTMGMEGFRTGELPTEERIHFGSYNFLYGGGFLQLDGRYSRAYEPRHHTGSRGTGRIPGWVLHIVSEGRLIQVDLRRRSVEVLFESPELSSVLALPRGTGNQPHDEADHREFLALRTADEVVVLDLQGNEEDRYVIPTDLREQTFTLYELDEEELLVETSKSRRSQGVTTFHLRWMNRAGETLREEQVELSRTLGRIDRRVEFCMIATVVPAPIVSTLVTALVKPLQYIGNRETNNYAEALSLSLADAWPALLLTYLLGAGLSYAVYRRQCRFGLSYTRWWMLFVFVLGLPGFMGYRLHRRWAPRLACPTCGAHAPRDRENCFACATEFPAPLPRGTEVFA